MKEARGWHTKLCSIATSSVVFRPGFIPGSRSIGGKSKFKWGQPHIEYRESQFPGERINPKGEHPQPPEINPGIIHVYKPSAYCDHLISLHPVHPLHDCCVLPKFNCWESKILMVAVATKSVDDMPSKQFTTVPFRSLLTGLTVTLDTNGRTSWLESLEKVITELLNVRGVGIPLVPSDMTDTE